jgi:hypothetical protein
VEIKRFRELFFTMHRLFQNRQQLEARLWRQKILKCEDSSNKKTADRVPAQCDAQRPRKQVSGHILNFSQKHHHTQLI